MEPMIEIKIDGAPEEHADKILSAVKENEHEVVLVLEWVGSPEKINDIVTSVAQIMPIMFDVDKLGGNRYGDLTIMLSNPEVAYVAHVGDYIMVTESLDGTTAGFSVIGNKEGNALARKLNEIQDEKLVDEIFLKLSGECEDEEGDEQCTE